MWEHSLPELAKDGQRCIDFEQHPTIQEA